MHQPVLFDPAPADDTVAPSIVMPTRPVLPIVSVPVAPPPPGALVMPVEPGYALPDVPTFEVLNLPPAPTIDLPVFDAEKPTFIEPPFNETWDFTPEPYTVMLMDKIITELDPMLQANDLLPDAIRTAMFQKGRSRIEVENQRAVDTFISDFGSRGFDLPPGAIAGGVREIRQDGQNKVAEYNRDIIIEQFKEMVENKRFAIVQGIAAEGVFITLHIEENKVLLQAAQFQRDSAMALLNSRISIAQLKTTIYQAEASVFEARIRASLATVELYKAQVEGEMAKGQINEQRVRLYEGMLRGIGVLVDFYRSRLEAVKIQSDVDKNIVDRYKATVDAFDSRWKAYASEVQGYVASVDGEGRKADVYKTRVEAQAKRVDAWASKASLDMDVEKLRMTGHGLDLETYKAKLSQFAARIQGEQTRLGAVAQRADALSRMYTAEASVESAASAATDRSFELGLSKAKAEVDAQLSRANMLVEQAKNLGDQLIAIANAKLQTSSQLAASTMSAVSYGASVSSQRSKGSSCSTEFNFQGEIIDA